MKLPLIYNIPFFILHHPPLKDRKSILIGDFSNRYFCWGINWEEGFPPEELTIPEGAIVKNKAELSLYYKHRKCWEYQYNHKIPYIIIIEDDFMTPETDLFNYFVRLHKQFELTDGDMIMYGSCCNIHPVGGLNYINWEKPLIFHNEGQTTRCLHCYGLTLDACTKILKHAYSNIRATDFKLNEIILQEKLKVFWAEPAILQATEEKLFTSSLKHATI